MSIKAKLTTFDATMIVVSLIIGIGIFRTPALVAASAGTPFLFFAAWILGGLVSFLGALVFAEIGSRFPKPGSYYQVVAENYGSGLAFMLNWTNMLIMNGAGAAAVAIIGAEYLVPVVGISGPGGRHGVQLTAAGLVALLLFVNYLGIKTGAWVQNLLSGFKIVMIAVLAAAAFLAKRGSTATVASAVSKPWPLALGAAFISVLYAYGGYQNTINFGADVRDARRNLPRAVLFGILIVIACYLAVNAAYFRALGMAGVASAELVAAETARTAFGEAGRVVVSLAIFISAMGFLNVTLMQMPRAYYAMAADRTLPRVFMKVNPRTQTQEFGLLCLGGIILLSIFFLGTFENILNYVMFVDPITIALVASTVFVLRRKAARSGEAFAGYRAPLFPILPIVFICFEVLVSVNVLVNRPREALYGTLLLAAGIPVFLLMRKVNKASLPDEPGSERSGRHTASPPGA